MQWATNPTWGKLKPASLRRRLIAEDSEFLSKQLKQERLQLLLINGSGVLKKLRREFSNELQIELKGSIEGLTRQATELYAERIFERIRVVAWSTNLQSSPGVTNALRQELPKRVAALVD